jgi:hypothetical protein
VAIKPLGGNNLEREMNPENVTAITTLLAMLVAFVLKNKTELNNKLIPVVLLVFMGIKNMLVTLGWLTPDAAPLVEVARSISETQLYTLEAQQAGWGFLAKIGTALLPSFIEAVLPVGVHSFLKNTFQGAEQRVLTKAKKRK